MRWLVGLALLAIVVRRIGTERIADAVRWADQRLELFSPRGAGLYARFAIPLLEPFHRRVADEAAALAPPTVLDVGTGPGALAIEIAQRCRSCSVVGVDVAPEMLATAVDRVRGAGVAARVSFRVADAAALPLADASIDVAVSTLSLHHWRDVPAILRELHRVVTPGGRVLIYDLRFSYSARQFAALVAQTPFAARGFSHSNLRAGPLPMAFFARFRTHSELGAFPEHGVERATRMSYGSRLCASSKS
jgi:SAM-dependent methyltransferase